MDYVTAPLEFKLRKVLRYLALYGPRRTHAKVMAQLHLRRRYTRLPPVREVRRGQTVAIVGCGSFAFSTIAHHLRRCGPVIGMCMDRHVERAASLSAYYRIPRYTTDFSDVIRHDAIELVYIATNHASHAEYAVEALRKGKSVYIEKPHVVSDAQLGHLVEAMADSPGRVFLGFNRPESRFGRMIRRYLARESGPGMYGWFVVGHPLGPTHWYRDPGEGGRVLGNVCHWTDFALRLAPGDPYPIRVTPAAGRAPDCDLVLTCTFADDTIAVIAFTAKGPTFEGVRERFSGQRGNCLVAMDDHRWLRIDVVDRKRRWFNLYRDEGHRDSIVGAYRSVAGRAPYDSSGRMAYVWNTGALFLRARQAIQTGQPVDVVAFEESRRRAYP
jgi:predicted dehydrogenase